MAMLDSSYELPTVRPGSPEEHLDNLLDRIEPDTSPQPKKPPLRVIDGTPAQQREQFIDDALGRALGEDRPPQSRPPRRATGKRTAKPRHEMTAEERLGAWVDAVEGPDVEATSQRAPRNDHTADAHAGLNHAELTRRATLFADARDAERGARQIVDQWNVALAQVAAEFPNGPPNPEFDPPQAWYRWRAHAEALQQLEPYVNRIVADADERRRAAFNELAAAEDAEFMRRNPDADGDLALHSNNILREHGLNDDEITAAWNGVGGAALTDPRVQSVIAEAVRYVTGRPLESVADLHSETVKYLREIGFGPDELTALGNGALISLRDHRSQQVLADAARGRMGAR